MNETVDDPRCPECGDPIGQTATYCMHCSADLTAERAAADADEDGSWDPAEASTAPQSDADSRDATSPEGETTVADIRDAIDAESSDDDDARQLLAPDGWVDNTLTAVVGIVGGIVVGVVGTVVLGVVTGSGWAVPFGLAAWLGATAYLVRRRTVQGAIATSSYAVTVVLLAVPLIALSPAVPVSGGGGSRAELFLALLMFVVVPAGLAAVVGWIASQYVPETASSDGA